MNFKEKIHSTSWFRSTGVLAVLTLANTLAHAAPVWNVNIGSELTTSDSFNGAAPDNTPPTPNPMTWASAPAAASSRSITMTATTASDPGGVDYFFDETSNKPDGADSGWQSSPTYTDTGIETVTVTLAAAAPSNGKLFVRVGAKP